MPALHSANIASKLLTELGGGIQIGPLLVGMDKPVQVVEMGATVSEILNLMALAAADPVLSTTATQNDDNTTTVTLAAKKAG